MLIKLGNAVTINLEENQTLKFELTPATSEGSYDLSLGVTEKEKLKLGSTATPWTPAPEDFDSLKPAYPIAGSEMKGHHAEYKAPAYSRDTTIYVVETVDEVSKLGIHLIDRGHNLLKAQYSREYLGADVEDLKDFLNHSNYEGSDKPYVIAIALKGEPVKFEWMVFGSFEELVEHYEGSVVIRVKELDTPVEPQGHSILKKGNEGEEEDSDEGYLNGYLLSGDNRVSDKESILSYKTAIRIDTADELYRVLSELSRQRYLWSNLGRINLQKDYRLLLNVLNNIMKSNERDNDSKETERPHLYIFRSEGPRGNGGGELVKKISYIDSRVNLDRLGYTIKNLDDKEDTSK